MRHGLCDVQPAQRALDTRSGAADHAVWYSSGPPPDAAEAPPADGGGPWQVLRLPAVQAALADQLWTLLSRRVPGHETHR